MKRLILAGVSVVWPRRGAPLVIAAYLTGSVLAAARRDAVLAKVGQIVSAQFS
jgi:hypothetical protein